jgi:hypothetical protein
VEFLCGPDSLIRFVSFRGRDFLLDVIYMGLFPLSTVVLSSGPDFLISVIYFSGLSRFPYSCSIFLWP